MIPAVKFHSNILATHFANGVFSAIVHQQRIGQLCRLFACIICFLFCTTASLFAQQTKANNFINQGNQLYKQQKFEEAATAYQKALEQKDSSNAAGFNLGNALVKNNKLEEAASQFESTANNSKDKGTKANSFYNQGVALSKQKKLEESIDAYKKALRMNPNDAQTRENLQKALNEKKQQDKQNKDDKKDKKDDKKKDDKKDKKKEEEEKKKKEEEEKKKQEQQKQKEQEQPQPKPQPSKLDKQQVERYLQALRQMEKNTKDKLNKKVPSVNQPEKDW
jgi:Ca-activated chloride channel homolog